MVIDNGWGIIHDNELTQGVIIDTKGTYQVAATIENAKSLDLERKKARADLNDPAVSEMEKIQILQKHPRWYEFVHKPTEALQLAAVSQRGMMIQFMKKQNPSKAVQMAAVRRNGLVIIDIPKPSEAVQMAAVKQNPGSIFRILGKQIIPSEAVQIAAVSADPSILELLQQEIKPSLKVMQAAGQTG